MPPQPSAKLQDLPQPGGEQPHADHPEDEPLAGHRQVRPQPGFVEDRRQR